MATIALVDDDKNILLSISMALEAEGFIVRTYTNGSDALNGVTAQPVDLIILDIKMPRMDGMQMLTQLRRHSDIPVIILTSKDDEEDELEGLQKGADDYIKKPFSQKLLIERVRALLRRGVRNKETTDAAQIIARGELTLDSVCHICSWRGTPVPLTITEFLVVKALAQRPGHVKSRDQLMTAAYGAHVYVDDRTVDSHIKRLRKKFRAIDPDFDCVETLYGVGYRYTVTP